MSALAVDRDQLIRDGMKYVHGIAWRISRHTIVELDDLIGYGYRGLITASRRYTPGTGSFGTFAQSHIRGAIIDGIRHDDPLGRRGREQHAMIDQARHRYATREHRFPTAAQLAAELGWTADRLDGVYRCELHAMTGSLDFNIGTRDDPATVAEAVADPDAAVERRAFADADRATLLGAVDQLADRERMVIALRYYEGMALHAIGDALGVTESRASQIHTKALKRLRAIVPDDLMEAA